MLRILGPELFVSGRITRRTVLKMGSLGMITSTPGSLRAESGRRSAVILLWQAGGASHLDMYDMKPEGPEEIRGAFRPIRTNLPGFDVCELLPRHTRIADKLAIVRSLCHSTNVHEPATHWLQTGHPLNNFQQRGQQQPSLGAVASYVRGGLRGLPGYACVPECYPGLNFYQEAAFLGARHNPFAAGAPHQVDYQPPDLALPADLPEPRFAQRRSLLEQVETVLREAETNGAIQAMDGVRQRAFEMVTSPQARQAFDLQREPATLRDRYGRHFYGQACLLARRLVEAGVTFVTVNLYDKAKDSWDDHYHIDQKLRARLPMYDQALAALVDDLHVRGLAGHVLVVAVGEFGRTPRIDAAGGRDHWCRAMTAILSGGGVRAGQVIGATTSDGAWVSRQPYSPADLHATIYRVLGIAPDMSVPTREGRPVRLLEHAQPIAELF